jgi:uncharacterized protein
MGTTLTLRVFISYTGQDLEAHANVVSDMVRRLSNNTGHNWVAIDHKAWSPSGKPSVAECMQQVASCDILVVLVALRYGWVPSEAEGGDGHKSITRLEVEHARRRGLEVIPFLVDDRATWPVGDIEGLENPLAHQRLDEFKNPLRQTLAGFFESPQSLEAPTLLALGKAAERIAAKRAALTPPPAIRRDQPATTPLYHDPQQPLSLTDRLASSLPKRILSLDSGGSRTVLLLGWLERLEQLLRARYGDADLRLSDYFDLIGASGVAALLAAELAQGRTVAEAGRAFCGAIAALYSSRSLVGMTGLTGSMFRVGPLRQMLDAAWGTATLTSPPLKTGFAVMLTRVDLSELSTFHNHPGATGAGSEGLTLARVLLGAASLPMYLPVAELPTADGIGQYFSGDYSVGPDPALHLFLVATSPHFPFNWRSGRRRISLLSLGAGRRSKSRAISSMPLLQAVQMMNSMFGGLQQQSHLTLAALTHEGPGLIAGENVEPVDESAALSYRRHDLELSPESLVDLGLPDMVGHLDELITWDRVDRLSELQEIGRRAALRDCAPTLLSPTFDIRPPVIRP